MPHWYTLEEARSDWIGAPDDAALLACLAVSQAECIAYAPIEDDDLGIPDGHRWAHLAHARNIWNASTVNPAGGFGSEGSDFVIRPFPLDWAIKQRLRPARVFGGVVG